jgi:small subunit ribosomal protein S21
MRDNRRNTKPYNKGAKGGENKPESVKLDPHTPVQAKPLEVRITDQNNFDRALRNFKSLVQKERILSTFKEKQSYEKPSVKKRRKANESKRKKMELGNKEEHSKKSK